MSCSRCPKDQTEDSSLKLELKKKKNNNYMLLCLALIRKQQL